MRPKSSMASFHVRIRGTKCPPKIQYNTIQNSTHPAIKQHATGLTQSGGRKVILKEHSVLVVLISFTLRSKLRKR